MAEPNQNTVAALLQAHYSTLKDGTTKEKITRNSTLAELGRAYGPLGKLATRTTSEAGTLQVDDGDVFPPISEDQESGFRLSLSYDTLLFAPCVLIECAFLDAAKPEASPYLTITAEFHFSKGASEPLSDFKYIEQDGEDSRARVEFTVNGATSSGFNISREVESRLDESEQAVFSAMKNLLNPPEPIRILFTFLANKSEMKELDEIHSMLPGGSGTLLPSIETEEYSCFPSLPGLNNHDFRPYRPYWYFLATNFAPQQQMAMRSPMCSLESRSTFRSLREFEVQHLISSVMMHREGYTNLLLWAGVEHSVEFFTLNDMPVIAMEFDPAVRWLGARKKGQVRLPQGLEVKMVINEVEYTAYHEEEVTELPKRDAYFIVTSHTLDKIDLPNLQGRYLTVSEIEPHRNSFVLNSTLQTLQVFRSKSETWHVIALNQLHDSLKEVDVVAGINAHDDPVISEGIKTEALQWMHECMPWDTKQKELLNSIHKAKGRLVLCTGISGTGKSLLELVLALGFVKMGGRALCTTTSNAGADHLARSLKELAKDIEGLRIYRIYSASKSTPLKDMTAGNVGHRKAGHVGGNAASFDSFKFSMKKTKQAEAWDHSIEAALLTEVSKKELQLHRSLHDDNPREILDIWEVFRRHYEADKAGNFSWDDSTLVDEYQASYELCKRHLISLADILILTNGNARCTEVVEAWRNAEKGFRRALALLVDEAANDSEVNFWNTLTSPALPRAPDLVVCFGDPRQIGPINTCSTYPRYNMFFERLNISLMGRLIEQGWPHVNLEEQRRMHPCLVDFPSAEFYGGSLRNSREVDKPLEEVEPGLKDALLNILAGKFGYTEEKAEKVKATKDDTARLAYLQLPDSELSRSKKGSIAIPDHVEIFFHDVLPHLQEHFGNRMRQECLLICGYSESVKQYRRKMYDLQKEQKHDHAYYPDICTIDAAQGRQIKMVVLDACLRHANEIRFVSVRGRANVAMTRATSVFWVLGGSLSSNCSHSNQLFDLEDGEDEMKESPWVRLKEKLKLNGQVHPFQRRRNRAHNAL